MNDKIGDSITFHTTMQIVNSLLESDAINKMEANLIKVAVNDRTLIAAGENKNKVRADILKNMLSMLLL